jgi:hypothetical protein
VVEISIKYSLSEEHKLRAFENRMVRIFALDKQEVIGTWITLLDKVLHNFVLFTKYYWIIEDIT